MDYDSRWKEGRDEDEVCLACGAGVTYENCICSDKPMTEKEIMEMQDRLYDAGVGYGG